jgi:hypothetical protein
MKSKVIVRWHDARLFPDTYHPDEIGNLNMSEFTTIGYLLSKDSKTIKLASEHDNDGKYRNIILIPTGSIISIRRLLLGSCM